MTNCASFPLVSALKGDLVGEWLPCALGDLYVLIASIDGDPPTRSAVIADLGLPAVHASDKATAAAQTNLALAQLFGASPK